MFQNLKNQPHRRHKSQIIKIPYYESLEYSRSNKENIPDQEEQSLANIKSLITSQKSKFTKSLPNPTFEEENSPIHESQFIKPQRSQILDEQMLNESPDFKPSLVKNSSQMELSMEESMKFDQKETIFNKKKINPFEDLELYGSQFILSQSRINQQNDNFILNAIYLIKGQVFVKFGRGKLFAIGKRLIHISQDLRQLVIRSQDLQIQKTYDIQQIVGILEGKNSENFKRYQQCQHSLCFTIQLKERSLDLEGSSFEQVREFMHCLKQLMSTLND